MRKNETKKVNKKQRRASLYHSIDRVFLLTIPMGGAFLVLVLFGLLSPLAALISFFLAVILMFWLAAPFLKELEVLINYLRQEAEGKVSIRMPKFAKRRREAFKIVQSFHQIKMGWLLKNKVLEAQTLSDTAILESLPEPLLMLNSCGDVVSANLAARQLLGGGIVFKKTTDILNDDAFLNSLNEVLEHSKEKDEIEFSLTFRNKKHYLKAVISWLPAMTKNGAEVVVLLNDVTKFKTFEKSQNAFFANASHELKTPLSVLSGFIETLQGAAKDDANAREMFLNIMAEQTTHMTDLVQDLLAISKLDLQDDAPFENISISDLIRSVFQALALKAEKQEKKLVLVEKSVLPPVKARSAELFRVFQNLVDNALKYSKAKSVVTVTLDCQVVQNEKMSSLDVPVQMLLISVHNKGPVIPQEEIAHLFERFYRMESNRQISGTGLGLAIAKEIVGKYQGQITVESVSRVGTTFTVNLPTAL